MEAMLAKLVSGLYGGPDALRKALGERQPTGFGGQDDPHGEDPHDEDGDPRVQRPYNVRTGRPTGLTTDPDNRAMQDEIFADPPERGGQVKSGLRRGDRGPWQVLPGDTQDQVIKALAEEAGFRVVRKGGRGDFAVGNGAPLSAEEQHEVMKSLLGSLADASGGRW
jgi:hypothetical protein